MLLFQQVIIGEADRSQKNLWDQYHFGAKKKHQRKREITDKDLVVCSNSVGKLNGNSFVFYVSQQCY